MYILMLTIIFITLVLISICISHNNIPVPPPPILRSSSLLSLDLSSFISPLDIQYLSFFNLSVRKTNKGFSGIIRSSSSGSNIYSSPYRIILDDIGNVIDFNHIDFSHLNLNNCKPNMIINGICANGIEDPNIFIYQNEEWIIANCLGSSHQHHPCIDILCIFLLSDPYNSFRFLSPPSSINLSQRQKNWSPFEYNGKLLCEYSLEPHIILEININDGSTSIIHNSGDNGRSITIFNSLRCGVPPILISNDLFLGIGHIQSYHTIGYLHFFYTFENSPPFRIINKSKPFKLDNAEKVQFASGLSFYNNNIYVSYGINDNDNRISSYNINTILNLLQ